MATAVTEPAKRWHADPACGSRIQRRRELVGLTQRELAAATGVVSAVYVCRIERGDRAPSLQALTALAGPLLISARWLGTGVLEPEEEGLARAGVDPFALAADERATLTSVTTHARTAAGRDAAVLIRADREDPA